MTGWELVVQVALGILGGGGGLIGIQQGIQWLRRRQEQQERTAKAVALARRDDSIKALHRRLDEVHRSVIEVSTLARANNDAHQGPGAIDQDTGTPRWWCQISKLEQPLAALAEAIDRLPAQVAAAIHGGH